MVLHQDQQVLVWIQMAYVSLSHSHIYERTGKTTQSHHKTKPTKSIPFINFSRTKRSLSQNELESFAEMRKVFTESFKRFEARTDYMKFMTTLDKLSEERDKANNH